MALSHTTRVNGSLRCLLFYFDFGLWALTLVLASHAGQGGEKKMTHVQHPKSSSNSKKMLQGTEAYWPVGFIAFF
ncbi:hypothetical protein BC939DRAFT_462417 [Gamsiella multidivaricata]|uniref:uncharacterized protein n=1 Tax=Gamsiella multidivaricata TaxID=101098 RepID=UPI002220D42F|nr:uncharacterized protein BC939DRAFT_462417 [Gamsiella multidivaricata]KAI7818656.1 hypothetical protein BC939DRAFT_462417 [Gamsiella multidivaricata]